MSDAITDVDVVDLVAKIDVVGVSMRDQIEVVQGNVVGLQGIQGVKGDTGIQGIPGPAGSGDVLSARPWLYLPAGANAGWLSIPDPPALAGATQLDIRWIEKPVGYVNQVVAAQGSSAGAATTFSFVLTTSGGSGNMNFAVSDGTTSGANVGRPIRPAIGAIGMCRVTWRSSDGRVQMFTKAGGTIAAMMDNTGWTQSGTDGTTLAAPLRNGTEPLSVGAYSSGSTPWNTNLIAFQIATTIDGTPFASWRSEPMQRNFTDRYGNVWTLNGTSWEWIDPDGKRLGNPMSLPYTLVGTGNPEGVVSAPVGTEYIDSAATANAVKWIKYTGTSTTGWRVVWADTGWRDITTWDAAGVVTGTPFTAAWKPKAGVVGQLRLRRDRNTCWAFINQAAAATTGGSELLIATPVGFRPAGPGGVWSWFVEWRSSSGGAPNLTTKTSTLGATAAGLTRNTGNSHTVDEYIQNTLISWPTSDAWPTTLPGTATASGGP